MPRSPLSIVETGHFLEILRQTHLSHREADDLLRGVLFVIARSPREGVRIAPGSRVWAMTFESPASPDQTYVLYYTFDAEKIYLLALRHSTED
jgi:hypothetical protein